MGNLFCKKLPDVEVEADDNKCCDDNICPSSCCIIKIYKNRDKPIS